MVKTNYKNSLLLIFSVIKYNRASFTRRHKSGLSFSKVNLMNFRDIKYIHEKGNPEPADCRILLRMSAFV